MAAAKTAAWLRFIMLFLNVCTAVSANNVFAWTQNKVDYPSMDRILENHLIEELSPKYIVTQCAMACLKNSKCKSYNFHERRHTCQLNSATHDEFTEDFSFEKHSLYFAKSAFTIDQAALGLCVSNPCQNKGRCLDTKDHRGEMDYTCVCDDGWSGRYCHKPVKPAYWSEWREQSPCSVSCEEGWRSKYRECRDGETHQKLEDVYCEGASVSLTKCTGPPCPKWENWGAWTECSTSVRCGAGYKSRSRVCGHGGVPGVDWYCMGLINDTAPCSSINCMGPARLVGGKEFGEGMLEIYNDITMTWAMVCDNGWDHNASNVACKQMGLPGVADVQEERDYKSSNAGMAFTSIQCQGHEVSIQACSHDSWSMRTSCPEASKPVGLQCKVHGQWSLWSHWGSCSVTCGHGDEKRQRKCNHPPALHGGKPCNGANEEIRPCIRPVCPDVHGLHASYTQDCTRLGIGHKRVNMSRPCAAVHGIWKPWSAWTRCSITCGGGTRSRKRDCIHPKHGGRSCTGKRIDTSTCKTNPCPIDGYWLAWSLWGPCDKSCGGGIQTRDRSCVQPRYNGRQCLGKASSKRVCNKNECPINGMWLPWGDWSVCDVTCGGGTQRRTRKCQEPRFGGKICEGATSQDRKCNTHHCPVAGLWLPWSEWGHCSLSCGVGTHSRQRQCQPPKYGGTDCIGDESETKNCNIRPCPVDGTFLAWSEWGPCSEDCGPGKQSRMRLCRAPQYGGKPCQGRTKESRNCNKKPCPVDGVWGKWSGWGSCDATCGTSNRQRQRQCHPPKYGGRNCTGSAVDTEKCRMVDCLGTSWDIWSAWGKCSKPCGVGTQTRNRECIYRGDGRSCVGPGNAIKNCNKHPCPVDGEWTKWSSWSQCSSTCSNGTTTRQRECRGRAHGGRDCVGDVTQTKDCHYEDTCSVDGNFTEWSQWGECSASCGNGTMSRHRQCVGRVYNGKDCEGEKEQLKVCNTHPCPVDGVFSEWSSPGVCTVSCGGGTRKRTRSCVGRAYGGKPCVGPTEETSSCNDFVCPASNGRFAEWGPWGHCSVTCGLGLYTRQRECVGYNPPGKDCVGPRTETGKCTSRSCPVDGVLSEWGAWQPCNVSCGGGVMVRVKTCTPPKHGGRECNGSMIDRNECNTHHCPVDGILSAWGNWSDCSVSCGGGNSVRVRQCTEPLYGGKDCEGNLTDYQSCHTNPCPVDGVMSDWGNWSMCSKSCGGGNTSRSRVCIEPKYGGEACLGALTEVNECNTHHCPVDGNFGMWTTWSTCSVSCGGGSQNRSRTCEGRAYGGQDCMGVRSETQACNVHECPVDGYYKEWEDWGTCSVSCGGGIQNRHRLCIQPKYGGKPCVGDASQKQDCGILNCPVDGVWLEWGHWGGCSTTCGGGQRTRTRQCKGPFYNGTDCVGVAVSSESCSTNPCPIPGEWMSWSSWSTCTVTCGGGVRYRTRVCDLTVHGNLTVDCVGDSRDEQACHMYPCRPLAATCSQLRQWGLQDSIMAEINPRGAGPMQVYCNMTAEAGVGVTVIGHNQEEIMNVTGYEGAGEYQVDVIYNATMKQVIAVIDASESCKQYIQWRCFGALFHNPSSHNERVTYWRNRTGGEADYWGGAEPGSGMCQCGMTGSCHDPKKVCNCDSNDGVWREDSGYITIKADLPITGFAAGDTEEFCLPCSWRQNWSVASEVYPGGNVNYTLLPVVAIHPINKLCNL